jgi:cell division GTPase FtsZ
MDRKEAIKRILLLGLLPFGSITNIFDKKYENLKPKPINIVGLGDAGTNAILYIKKKGVKAKYLSIVSEQNNQKKQKEVSEIVLKKDVIFNDFQSIFQKNNINVLIVGLGGKTGTVLVERISNYLSENNIDFSIICTTPFALEGRQRLNYSFITLNNLQKYRTVKHYNLQVLTAKDLTISKAFGIANEKIYLLFKHIYS